MTEFVAQTPLAALQLVHCSSCQTHLKSTEGLCPAGLGELSNETSAQVQTICVGEYSPSTTSIRPRHLLIESDSFVDSHCPASLQHLVQHVQLISGMPEGGSGLQSLSKSPSSNLGREQTTSSRSPVKELFPTLRITAVECGWQTMAKD